MLASRLVRILVGLSCAALLGSAAPPTTSAELGPRSGWDDRFTLPGIVAGPGYDDGFFYRYQERQQPVQRLRVLGDRLFVLGNHEGMHSTPSRDVIAYDGSGFHAFGDRLEGTAYDAADYEGHLVIGGWMLLGEGPASVVRWDGTTWSPLGEGLHHPSVERELMVIDGELVVQGFFSDATGDQLATLGRFDGQAWSPFPIAGDPTLDADERAFEIAGRLVLHRGDWFVWNEDRWDGYDAPLADVQPVASDGVLWGLDPIGGLVRWDGDGRTTYRPLGIEVERLFPFGDTLLILAAESTRYLWRDGELEALPGQAEGGVACDDDGSPVWCARIASLALFQGRVFSGGNFTWDDDNRVGHLSEWRDRRWEAVAPAAGLDRIVRLLGSHGNLVVANAQVVRGDMNSNDAEEGLAVWDGDQWTSLPNEGRPTPFAVSSFRGHLVVGSADGVHALRGERWMPVGDDSPRFVRGFARLGGSLFAITRSGVHEFSRGAWRTVAGVGSFWTVEAHGNDLVVAGEFESIEGVPALNVARWDGRRWHALGNGVPLGKARRVQTLHSDRAEGVLYAGLGDEGATSPSDEALYVFHDGAWTPLGLRGHSIHALVRHQGQLVVAGREFHVDGEIQPLVTHDGDRWCALEAVGLIVNDLLSEGRDLYVGGRFQQMEGIESVYIARWSGPVAGCGDGAPEAGMFGSGPRAAADLRLTASPNPFNPSTTVHFTMPTQTAATATVYDLRGRALRTWRWTSLSAGQNQVVWQGRDDGGRPVASGVYLLVIRAGDFMDSQRLVLLK